MWKCIIYFSLVLSAVSVTVIVSLSLYDENPETKHFNLVDNVDTKERLENNEVDVITVKQIKKSQKESEIINVAKKLEACTENENIIKANLKQSKNKINSWVKSQANKSSLSESLHALIAKEIINHHEASMIMNDFLLSKWKLETNKLNISDAKSIAVSNVYLELEEAIYNNNMEKIKFWLKENNVRKEKPLILTHQGSDVYIDAQTLLAINLPNLNAENRKWVIENVEFNAMSINSAIEHDLSLDMLSELLDATQDKESLFFVDDNSPQNILSSALKSKKIEIIELILSKSKFINQELINPMNDYYLSIASENVLTSEDDVILNILNRHNIKPAVFYNSNNEMELVGVPNGKMDFLMSNLMRHGVDIKANLNLVTDSIIINDKLELILGEFKYAMEELSYIKSECKNLNSKLIDMEPPFQPVNIYESNIFKDSEQEALFLKEKSPVLFDNHIRRLLTASNSVDDFLNAEKISRYSDDELSKYMQTIDAKFPYQQQIAINYLCNRLGVSELYTFIDRGWYMDINLIDNKLCPASKYMLNELNEYYTNNKLMTPSLVYRSLQNFDLDKVKLLLIDSMPTHGFNGGRDGLALLLDRIIPFRAKVSAQYFELLELMLEDTQLTEMHYKRLHRLQLKYPNYFNELRKSYPQIDAALDYPLSQFNSFL